MEDKRITRCTDKPCSESVVSWNCADEAEKQNCNGHVSVNLDVVVSEAPSFPNSENGEDKSALAYMEADGSSEYKSVVHEETGASASTAEIEKPLNFESFNSAGELEVLSIERLKTELQARGLKCGGTLQERAARLFLLKSTPLDKLPKNLRRNESILKCKTLEVDPCVKTF